MAINNLTRVEAVECDYRIRASEGENPVAKTEPWEVTRTLEKYNREQSVWSLVKEAIEVIQAPVGKDDTE